MEIKRTIIIDDDTLEIISDDQEEIILPDAIHIETYQGVRKYWVKRK